MERFFLFSSEMVSESIYYWRCFRVFLIRSFMAQWICSGKDFNLSLPFDFPAELTRPRAHRLCFVHTPLRGDRHDAAPQRLFH